MSIGTPKHGSCDVERQIMTPYPRVQISPFLGPEGKKSCVKFINQFTLQHIVERPRIFESTGTKWPVHGQP